MGWRQKIKLSDLAPDEEIEVECRACTKVYMCWVEDLQARPEYTQLYIDELQAALKCRDKYCPGRVKVAILYDHLMRKFTAGMALKMTKKGAR